MIGVNVLKREPKMLKAVMDKEKINWRTFTNDGTIVPKWNYPATPAFYILDHRGVIRHKWIGHPGEKAIDSALEKLIRKAEFR